MITKPKILGKYKPLYIDRKGTILASKGYCIYISINNGLTFKKHISFSADIVNKIAVQNRLTTRLTRAGFHYLTKCKDGTILAVVRKKILKCNKDEKIFRSGFNISRGSRPLNICTGDNGKVFWGEYFNNPDRDEVHIYSSEDYGESWHICYTFKKGSIRHVHGIFFDNYKKGYWILTGDKNSESRICFTDDFRNIETVAKGSQYCRAVNILVFKDGLIVPTDTPLQQNYIQWMDIKSLTFNKIRPIPGSAFYSLDGKGYYLLSTAVENSKINKDSRAYLYISYDGKSWRELYKQKKDLWNKRYFQFGLFSLPSGPCGGDYMFCGGQAIQNVDGRLLRWPIIPEEEKY